MLIGHHGFLHMPVDLLLRPKGGAHKPIQCCHLQEATDQANPTRANLDKHHMERHDQAMQERETRTAFKKCYHLRTRIQTLLPYVPRLQRGTWDMQRSRSLTLG